MMPVTRKRDPSWPTDILFADSKWPFWGKNTMQIYGRWYRTAFAYFQDEKGWIAQFHDYPASEFDLLSPVEGQKRRVADAEIAALGNLIALNDAGLFDDARKADFAQH